jgi:RNA polymerase sigma factor, sigma-70 family
MQYPNGLVNWGYAGPLATPLAGRTLESKELLARLRRGDEAAFDAIFRQWYPSLVRASETIVRSQAVAEEIVQDVMLELWKRRESLAEDSSPQAYLFQSARNRSLNHVRHEKVAREGEPYATRPEAVDSTAHSSMVEDEMAVAVRRAVRVYRAGVARYSSCRGLTGSSIRRLRLPLGFR